MLARCDRCTEDSFFWRCRRVTMRTSLQLQECVRHCADARRIIRRLLFGKLQLRAQTHCDGKMSSGDGKVFGTKPSGVTKRRSNDERSCLGDEEKLRGHDRENNKVWRCMFCEPLRASGGAFDRRPGRGTRRCDPRPTRSLSERLRGIAERLIWRVFSRETWFA
jgi:hypothetical protein